MQLGDSSRKDKIDEVHNDFQEKKNLFCIENGILCNRAQLLWVPLV